MLPPLTARVGPFGLEGAPPESAPEVSNKHAIRQLAALKESLSGIQDSLKLRMDPLRSGMGPLSGLG